MRTYETLIITLPTLTEDEERAAVDGFAQVVSDAGGVVAVRDRMGRRRLAYTVKKFEEGVYNRLLYDAEPAVPKELDRRLRINDKVLRHLTVYLEPEWGAFSKEQAIRDAQARAEAEAARAAGLAAEAEAEAEGTDAEDEDADDRDEGPDGDDRDEDED